MKVYEIVLEEGEGKLSAEKSHYILAENFCDAYKQAQKLLSKALDIEDGEAEITSITEQFNIELVK